MEPNRLAVAGRLAATAIPATFITIFFFFPMAAILTRGLRDQPTISASGLAEVAWFTLIQACASTALTLAIGLPAAHGLRHSRAWPAKVVRAVLLVPFVLPTVVVGAAISTWFDFLSVSAPLLAIIIAHAVFNIAVVVRVVGGYWALLDPRAEDAAAMLGAAPTRVFRTITLPRLLPAIAGAGVIVFLFCFTSFGVVMILGSGSRTTIEAEIWRYAVQRTDFASAALLTIVQLIFVAVLLIASSNFERRLTTRESPRQISPATTRTRALAWTLPALLIVVPPLVVIAERAFATRSGYGFSNFTGLNRRTGGLSVRPLEAVGNSLSIALVAAAIATGVGGLASIAVAGRRRVMLDRALMLPLGVSSVSLGFGFLIALAEPPIDLRTSWWLIPLAQALVGLPFVLRTAVPALRTIDPRLRDAATMLGAAPAQVWQTVEWPVLRRALTVGGLFATAVAIGEFGATSFLARPDRPTMPTAIFRLLSRPGGDLRGMAMALSMILSLLVICLSLLSEHLRPRGTTLL